MTVEGFKWLVGSLMRSISMVQRITWGIATFGAVSLLLMVLGAVYCHRTNANERKWQVFRSFVSGAGCLFLVALEFNLVYYVVLGKRYLSLISGSVSMLSEYCEEVLHGFQVENISLLCAACMVAAFIILGAFFYSCLRFCKYVRTLVG